MAVEVLLAMHWSAVVLTTSLIALLVVYIIAHRAVARQELRRFVRAAYGRYFLLGICIGLSAEFLGWAGHLLAKKVAYFPHEIIEEPMELLATMCVTASIVALWRATDGGRKPVVAITPGEEQGN